MNRSAARLLARALVICAVLLFASTHTAQAGINVWTSHGPEGRLAFALAIDPTTPGILYAGTDGPTFESVDGGGSWRAINAAPSNVFAFVIDPTNPRTLYAGTFGDGAFKSTDGGDHWRAINTGLSSSYVVALAIDPTMPRTLYAGTDGGAFKSTEGGDSWQAINAGLSSTYLHALAIDPTTPGILYAGTDGGAFKSTDGGGSWQAINAGLSNTSVQAFAIDPTTPRTLYAGTSDNGDPNRMEGVFKSTNGGNSWQAINADLSKTPVWALAIAPTTPSTLYAGTSGGVFSIRQVAAKLVGTGTAASCTDAALNAALAGGGLVTFDCGPDPVTIDIGASTGTGTKTIATDTTIDGGNLITLSGGHTAQVFRVLTGATFTVEKVRIADGLGGPAGRLGRAGAGILNSGMLTVTNSTFFGNSADNGAGIVNAGTLTVTNSTFFGNSASNIGGGILNLGDSLTIINSTFFGNSAGDTGGCISNLSGSLTIINSTFSGNSATNMGGGIVNEDRLTVSNTIIAKNTNGDCVNDLTVTDGGHNLIGDAGNSCDLTSGLNGDIVGVDPMLAPLGLRDNGGPTQTVALCTAVGAPIGCTAESPAIDAGDQAICAAAPVNSRDQRGFVRPGPGHTNCSIGAYEADATAPGACIGDCDAGGSVTVDEIITLVNIALGNAQPATCMNGVPSGTEINITFIIQAVGNALDVCPAPIPTPTSASSPRPTSTPYAAPTSTRSPTPTLPLPHCVQATPLPDVPCDASCHTNCRLFGRQGTCRVISEACTCDTEGPTPTATPLCQP